MNGKTRFIIAAIVTLVLAIAATTVWAGSKESSLGPIIQTATQKCNTTINMGDATFTITVAEEKICNFTVTRLKVPNTAMGGAPEGLEFRSDGFEVSAPLDIIGMLEMCFAYSPLDEEKNAQIYALFGNQSAILPDIKIGPPAQLCAATENLNGIFALVGNP
jgi:hypothetical protein